MIIAIAADGNEVSMHFGRCEKYVLYEIKNKEIINKKEILNPGHKPFFLPKFLANKNVNVLITGEIGPRAIDMFNSLNIKVISGVNGKIENVIKRYLRGELAERIEPCNKHK